MIEQKRRLGLKIKKGGYIQNESLAAGANLSVPVDLVDISADSSEALLNPSHGSGFGYEPLHRLPHLHAQKRQKILNTRGPS